MARRGAVLRAGAARALRVPAAVAMLALLAAAPARAEIVNAAYVNPTDRYGNGALGPAGEWAGMVMLRHDGLRMRIDLTGRRVFEDYEPRLADLTGDGAPEVVVVESDRRGGSQIVVYGEKGRIAATPQLGKRNRWLAVVGIADLDGDGVMEIAYVEQPHVAPMLKVVQLRDGSLLPLRGADGAAVPPLRGLANHRRGDGFLQGGIATCADGPVMVLADALWKSVMQVRLRDGALTAQVAGPYAGPASLSPAAACPP